MRNLEEKLAILRCIYVKLTSLIEIIEKTYPQSLQEDWDSSGLLIEREDISKVLVCLDLTSNVLEYAKAHNFDLIISHHPLIFGDYCNSYPYIRDLFQNLYASKIATYSMHTNYDNHGNGMNDLFLRQLGYQKLNDSELCLVTFEPDEKLYQTLSELNFDVIRSYNKRSNLKKGAILLGSGGSFIEEVKNKSCDVFISSEFKQHEILYAKEYNITLIDVAHQAEMIFVDDIVSFIQDKIKDIEVTGYKDYYIID